MRETGATLGKALRRLRDLAGLRLDDAAAKADVSAAALARVEDGTVEPGPEWIGAVATAIAAELAEPSKKGTA